MSKEIFENLYKDINGYSLSWKAKDKMSEEETKNLIYGEISYDSMCKIYDFPKIKSYLKKNKSFCDLGSGVGRVVFSTSLILPNYDNYCGIELLKSLYETSLEIDKKFKDLGFNNNIKFINNSFFNVDLSDFDVIFMHYPMKNAEELYLKLEDKMKKELKSNSLIISAIRKLNDLDNFIFIGKETIHASYGDMTMYYHIKK